MAHHQILIVGGGNAGISVAAKLLLKRSKLDIAIIEPSEKHFYQPAWTLVGAGAFKMEDTIKNEADYIPKGVKWIKDAVATFNPEKNEVTTISGTNFTYDYLIVAPGIQLDWDKIKGLKENLGKNGVTSNYHHKTAPYTWDCLKNFKGGNVIFTAPNTPVKCGGAPQKIMYLVGDYILKNGLQPKSNIHFYSGGTIIFGVKKYAETLLKAVNRYKIQTHFYYNLVEIKGEERVAVFEDDKGNRVEEKFEFIHVTPPQSAPDFIKQSQLASTTDPFGWVDVDKHTLQHVRYPNIFSLGDAANVPTARTGAAIRKQAPVLVQNLFAVMDGKPVEAQYTGYTSCPLVTGYGKIVLAEFDYNNEPMETFPFNQAKERWSMWLLKKYILPWLYWNQILPGKM